MNQPGDPTVYELLATQQCSATSISNLHSATKSTYVSKENVEFWSGVITVARALKESRQFGGLAIPEQSAIDSNAVADSGTHQLKPSGTEVWQVLNVFSGAATVALTDGTNSCPVPVDANGHLYSPLYLTPTLYLEYSNSSGGEVTVRTAYNKVSL